MTRTKDNKQWKYRPLSFAIFMAIVIVAGVVFQRGGLCHALLKGYHVLNSIYTGSRIDNEDARFQIKRYIGGVNNSLKGQPFGLDRDTEHFIKGVWRNLTFKRTPIVVNSSMELFDFAVAVTAASSNHFEEFEHNIRNFSHRFPRVKVFFYDIGLEELQVIAVKKLPFVMYRKFNFAAYPNHVQNLLNYAWKLLIIQELISEYDGVMWFDSSIVFTRDVSHFIPLMFTAKSGILFYLQIYSRMHSIRAATHPQMIKYFPASEDGLLSDMLPGGCILVLNTADVQQHILPWTTLCALHKNCIQPTGANKDCPRRIWGLPRNQYANCHRFDQALFSLVVGNLYGFELSRYRLNRTEAPAHVAHLLK